MDNAFCSAGDRGGGDARSPCGIEAYVTAASKAPAHRNEDTDFMLLEKNMIC